MPPDRGLGPSLAALRTCGRPAGRCSTRLEQQEPVPVGGIGLRGFPQLAAQPALVDEVHRVVEQVACEPGVGDDCVLANLADVLC